MAPRVTEPAAPPVLTAAQTLVELYRYCVVLPLGTFGRLVHQHVAELREGPQELAARDRRPRAELARRGDAEERIGHRLSQLRRIPAAAQREELVCEDWVDLVDVDRAIVRAAEADVTAGCADVADGQRHGSWQLPLDVGGILMDLGVALVLIHEVH